MTTEYITTKYEIEHCQCNDHIEAGTTLTLVSKIFTETDELCGFIVLCPHCNHKLILCTHCEYARPHSKGRSWYVRNGHRQHCCGVDGNGGDNDFDNNVEGGEVEGDNDATSSSSVRDDDMDNNNFVEVGVDLNDASYLNDDMSFNHFESVFPDTRSARFFFDQHRLSGTNFGGARGMVYRCMNEIIDGTEFVDEDTTKLYLELFAIVYDLPESKQRLQMKFLKRLYEMNQPRFRPGESGVKIPLTHLELNQQLLRNRSSLMRQLPIERFVNVDNKHAMVSIDDTITLAMAHGDLPLGWLQTEDGTRCNDGVNGCPAAQRLLDEQRNKIRAQGKNPDKVAIGWVSAWSDGFVTSWVKQKEKGAWLFTITICMPGDSRSFELYTHVVGLGPQDADHDTMINQALREIDKLAVVKKRYCGIRKEWIDTAFVFLVYAADRPERHKITYTSDGGNFGKCFGVAAFLDRQNLPSCERCFQSRVLSLTCDVFPNSDVFCNHCCDWDFDTPESEGWKKAVQLSRFFPTDELTQRCKYPTTLDSAIQTKVPQCRPIPETSHIRPQRLTFELLIQCVAVSFYHLTLEKWHKYHMESYLSSIGVNDAVWNMCAKATIAAKEEISNIQDETEKEQKVKSMMCAKELLRLKAIPEVWFIGSELGTLNLSSYIEIPMHHLFTGITKDFVNMLMAILTKGGQKTKFNKLANPFIQYLGSTLRLAFCIPRKLPNKKWLSENYIAFARMTPFMFGIYFNKYDGSNAMMLPQYSILLQRLVNIFNVLISTLMRPNQANISRDVIDNVVKIYLSCLNDLDNAIGGKVTESIGLWSKQNPISLLNLGKQIEDKGPVRYYWDGRNEEKISECKADLSKMRLSLSFFQTKLARIRRRVALRNILRHVDDNSIDIDGVRCYDTDDDDYDDTSSDDDDDEGDDMAIDRDYNINANTEVDGADGEADREEEDGDDADRMERGVWYRGCYRYKSLECLQSAFSRGEFVSCYLRRGGGLWAYVSSGHSNKEKTTICEIMMEDDVQKCCGSSFFRFRVSDSVKTMNLEESKKEIVRNCLLLPYHGTTTFGSRFAAITDEWEILGSGLSISYPTIDEGLFEFQPQNQQRQLTNEHARNKRRRTS